MEDIVCQHCGVVNDYDTNFRTFRNGTRHKEAICNSCGKHIKFVKQDKPRTYIPFGKYKGSHTYQVNDDKYLKWLVTVVDDKRLKIGIENRIKELNAGCGHG